MRRALVAAACVLIWACGETTLEPLPLSIDLQANRTSATPGDTIQFVVRAEGGTLLGIDMDYGDGETAQLGTSGARTARATFSHVYLTKGSFQVQSTITDASAGSKSAGIVIAVN